MSTEEHICPVRPATSGPPAHWFGYYDKPPWDATGRYMLCLEAEDHGRLPAAGEKATVALIDLETDTVEPLTETRAWNWQQGCMLQWLPSAPDREIIFNDCQAGMHVAVVLDVRTGKRRVLPKPIYSVSSDGRFALCISLARLAHARPIVGYAGVADPYEDQPHPREDGIHYMDLQTGETSLVLSLDTAANLDPLPSMQGELHRFEHVMINPNDTRFMVIHRWPRHAKGRPFFDRLLTANIDGSGLCRLADDDMVSHFFWRDPEHLLAWCRHRPTGDHFYLHTDQTDELEVIGEDVLTKDGHCSYSPDRRWIVSDTYPDAKWNAGILLYEVATNRRIDIGCFPQPQYLYKTPGIRCDLHPRWSRDGKHICIDSAHEDPRQMYLIDVSAIV